MLSNSNNISEVFDPAEILKRERVTGKQASDSGHLDK
jgi:hypothetical protein